MDGDETGAKWKRLAHQVAQSSDIEEGVKRLTDAIAGQRDTLISCEQCRATLARFVEEEQSGFDVGRLCPDTKRHMDTCPACESAYVDMLTLIEIDQRAGAVVPEIAIELSFLPPLSFTAYLREILHDIVEHAYPAFLPSLEATTNRLLTQFQRGLTPQVREASVAYGDTPSAADIAYLTYTTAAALTSGSLDEGSAPIIYHTAYEYAHTRGFSEAVCDRFAATFTATVLSQTKSVSVNNRLVVIHHGNMNNRGTFARHTSIVLSEVVQPLKFRVKKV